jgi:hypothetical protein
VGSTHEYRVLYPDPLTGYEYEYGAEYGYLSPRNSRVQVPVPMYPINITTIAPGGPTSVSQIPSIHHQPYSLRFLLSTCPAAQLDARHLRNTYRRRHGRKRSSGDIHCAGYVGRPHRSTSAYRMCSAHGDVDGESLPTDQRARGRHIVSTISDPGAEAVCSRAFGGEGQFGITAPRVLCGFESEHRVSSTIRSEWVDEAFSVASS